jgi:hypothetical protein
MSVCLASSLRNSSNHAVICNRSDVLIGSALAASGAVSGSSLVRSGDHHQIGADQHDG